MLPGFRADLRLSCPGLLHNVQEEATKYGIDYVKKYDEDPNTTPIFVRHLASLPSCQVSHLFSQAGPFPAISSMFVVNVHSNPQPDLNEPPVDTPMKNCNVP